VRAKMAQTMYAHVNKLIKKRKNELMKKKVNIIQMNENNHNKNYSRNMTKHGILGEVPWMKSQNKMDLQQILILN
jgi:hypothetical protein